MRVGRGGKGRTYARLLLRYNDTAELLLVAHISSTNSSPKVKALAAAGRRDLVL